MRRMGKRIEKMVEKEHRRGWGRGWARELLNTCSDGSKYIARLLAIYSYCYMRLGVAAFCCTFWMLSMVTLWAVSSASNALCFCSLACRLVGSL